MKHLVGVLPSGSVGMQLPQDSEALQRLLALIGSSPGLEDAWWEVVDRDPFGHKS